MRKTLVIANMLFASACVFGMNNNIFQSDNSARSLWTQYLPGCTENTVELFIAIENEDASEVKSVLESSEADVNAECCIPEWVRNGAKMRKVERRMTPLLLACMSYPENYTPDASNIQIIEMLISNSQTDFTKQDDQGRNALFWLVQRNSNPELVKLMLEYVEDSGTKNMVVNQRDKNGITPLSVAISNSYTELVEILKENGAYM